MSIHKTGSGTFRVRWRSPQGKLCSKSFPRKSEAEVFEAKLKTGEESRNPRTEVEISFRDFSVLWMETYAKAHKTASSAQQDEAVIRLYFEPRWGGGDIADIRRIDVISLQAELTGKRSPKTINNVVGLLKKMLADAKDWELIKANPCDGVKPIKAQRRTFDFWSAAEARRFFSFCSSRHPRLCEVIELAFHTGMRRGEIAGLKRDCLDFDRRMITVKRSFDCHTRELNEYTKGKKARQIPMNPVAYRLLKKHQLLAPDQLIYGPSIESMILKNFANVCKEAKVRKIRFHDLRHTFASHMAMEGVELFDLAQVMGHSTVGMTERYSHFSPERLRGMTDVLCRDVPLKFPRPESEVVSIGIQ